MAVEGCQLEFGTWEREVALKVLDLATDAGLLTREERAQLDVEVTEPTVVTPDPEKDTRRLQVLNQSGVLSPQTWQLKEQLDPQHEAENWKAWRDSDPRNGEQPPGAGGQGPGDGGRPDGNPPGGGGFGGDPFGGSFSESAPGPPPRAGLVWNDSTHRWKNPHTGEETSPAAGAGLPAVLAAYHAAPARAKEYLAAELGNAGIEDPDRPPGKVDPALLARRVASAYRDLSAADGTPEELDAVRRAAAAAGVEFLGEPGAEATFDGATMSGPPGVFPGKDRVRLLSPALTHAGRVLVKARVERA